MVWTDDQIKRGNALSLVSCPTVTVLCVLYVPWQIKAYHSNLAVISFMNILMLAWLPVDRMGTQNSHFESAMDYLT